MSDRVTYFAGRAQIFGDTISATPLLHLVKKRHPNSRISWPIALKAKSVIPFIKEHELIDEIILSNDQEGNSYTIQGKTYNQKTDKLPFDFSIDCNPTVSNPLWMNEISLCEENCILAGFSREEFASLSEDEKIPKLPFKHPIKKINSIKPVIFVQLACGYGQDVKRTPSPAWWDEFIPKITDKYTVIQFGHPKDYKSKYTNGDITELELVEQFQYIMGGNLFLGLENGLSWLNGSINKKPMITLLTNAVSGHNQNFLAWQPLSRGPNMPIFAEGNINNINQKDVIDSIETLISV